MLGLGVEDCVWIKILGCPPVDLFSWAITAFLYLACFHTLNVHIKRKELCAWDLGHGGSPLLKVKDPIVAYCSYCWWLCYFHVLWLHFIVAHLLTWPHYKFLVHWFFSVCGLNAAVGHWIAVRMRFWATCTNGTLNLTTPHTKLKRYWINVGLFKARFKRIQK